MTCLVYDVTKMTSGLPLFTFDHETLELEVCFTWMVTFMLRLSNEVVRLPLLYTNSSKLNMSTFYFLEIRNGILNVSSTII